MTPLASALLARVVDRSTIPRYGSPQWSDLPDQDPRRAAAVIIAAESWRDYCSPERIEAELRFELEQDRWALRQASWDVSAAHDWAAESRRATFAELRQRRAS